MSSKNNLEDIAILHEELTYRPHLTWKIKDNPDKYARKAKMLIFKYISEVKNMNESQVKLEMMEIIKSLIDNDYLETNNYQDLQLLHSYQRSKDLKDLQNKFDFPQRSLYMKELFKKELVELEKKVKIYHKKLSKHNQKNNFLNNKLAKKMEVKLLKTKLRIKDVKSFIKNRSVYKKVYLSDDPPLTPLGWVKLLFSYGLMFLWAVIILWPLGELVKATLNDNAKFFLNTEEFTFGFDSFKRLFNETDFTNWLINTLIVAGITSIITVFMALLMGYAFSRFRFKGKRVSLLTIMLLQMVPTMAALTVFYVLYTILNQQFSVNGLVVLILIYVGGGVAGNTFIMKGYMDSISMEIDEAAKIDGLSQWKIFTRIMIPLTKPMIALVALWSFIGPFGDFILPGLLLSDSKEFTLAKGLNTLVSDPQNQDQGAFAAGAVLISVPIAILFVSLRKFLIGGITAGGVKG